MGEPLQPFLALCMIIRDAEQTIGALLDSVSRPAPTGLAPRNPFFDEYIFLDTGSTDGTKKIIAKSFGLLWPDDGQFQRIVPVGEKEIRVVFASMRWPNDFAQARNHAFSLATGKWRMYLDADDVLEGGENLVGWLHGVERRNPNCNAIVLPYAYSHDTTQDTTRIFRWADGWAWKDPIHEECVRSPPGHRGFAKCSEGIIVRHNVNDERRLKSLKRNVTICEAALEKANSDGDGLLAGRMLFFLGSYRAFDGEGDVFDAKKAEENFKNAIPLLGTNNIGGLARVNLAFLLADQDRFSEALLWASEASGLTPELPEGLASLAIIHAMSGDYPRAAFVFDQLRVQKETLLQSTTNLTIVKGMRGAWGAITYATLGRLDDATQELAHITPAIRPQVLDLATRAQVLVLKKTGLERLRAFIEFCRWDTESVKAIEILESLVPAGISDMMEVQQMLREVRSKVPQLASFEAYQKTYASMPAEEFAPNNVGLLTTGRAKAAIEWAQLLSTPCPGFKYGPGEPQVIHCRNGRLSDDSGDCIAVPPCKPMDLVHVCSIGFADGTIEREVLKASTRIRMCVVDVAPQSNETLQRLVAEFPGQVTSHPMGTPTDWPTPFWTGPQTRRYDAVFCFEVLEHLEDTTLALNILRQMLADDGTLFLSCPVADRWIEPHLTGPSAPAWNGHVRAFNPSSLWADLRYGGLDGRLETTDHGSNFLFRGHRAFRNDVGTVAIYVPNTPQPFDPDTLKHKHLGGSEEAVVHLSAALARRGYEVTVYSPRPKRKDGIVVHAEGGVLWREPDDFDAAGDTHDAVLFWRCPALLAHPTIQAGKYCKINWLHDTSTGCPVSAYEAADATIVLSKCHEKTIWREDGFKGPFSRAQNGIDLASFPELDATDDFAANPSKWRNDKKVIYASSPDRGLLPLLENWSTIKKAVPDATLDIYYSWDGFRRQVQTDATAKALLERLEGFLELHEGQGVVFHGGVDHATLHAAYRRSGVWAYFVPTFLEISCISAMKAQAAGCWPVVSNVGALPETTRFGGSICHSLASFISETIHALKEPPTFEQRKKMSDAAREAFSWDKTAERFAEIIDGEES